jgi:hypothetical protein
MELLKDVRPTPEGPFAAEGRVFCRLFGRYIGLAVEDAASLDYARRCAGHMDTLPDAVVDALCAASMRYCDAWRAMNGEGRIAFASVRDVLRQIDPNTLIIPNERRPEPVVHLELNCDWDAEHGLEWIVRGGEVLYVGGFSGGNPWADWHEPRSWNFA